MMILMGLSDVTLLYWLYQVRCELLCGMSSPQSMYSSNLDVGSILACPGRSIDVATRSTGTCSDDETGDDFRGMDTLSETSSIDSVGKQSLLDEVSVTCCRRSKKLGWCLFKMNLLNH